MKNAQSAVEFLSVYAFAMVIIAIVISIAFILGTSHTPSNNIFSSCSIEPLMPCHDAVMVYNAVGGYTDYIVLFTNQVGYTLYFPSNSFALTTTGIGSSGTHVTGGDCSPAYASDGSEVICNSIIEGSLSPGIGSTSEAYFSFGYQLCSQSNASVCYAGAYNSTGYSTSSIGPPGSYLHRVTLVADNGLVLIDGATYFGGTSFYLTNGIYQLYAMPLQGHAFVAWASSPAGAINPASTDNAILTLASDETVTAEFS